jgi:hypothetical protein
MTRAQQKANRKLWIDALRSGKYRQTKEKLKSTRGGMCCLGVLADLAGCEWTPNDNERGFNADGIWGYAPSKAMEFVGLVNRSGQFGDGDIDGYKMSLAALNDAGKRFKTIADIIESEPSGLFKS